MNEAAARLNARVVILVAAFSLLTAALLLLLVPELLLLHPRVARAVVTRYSYTLLAASVVGVGLSAWRLGRHRFLLRALALGSRSTEHPELDALGFEAGRVVRWWLVPFLIAEATVALPFRPAAVDLRTGMSVALLSAIFTAAVSLLVYGFTRATFLSALELSPQESMREVVESSERSGVAQARIARRLLIAVATPVALVALGSALVANAHVRRVEQEDRETTARVVARAAFDASPGIAADAGLHDALKSARALGFRATRSDEAKPYELSRKDDGTSVVTVPLDSGSAEVRFHGSEVPVLGLGALIVTLFIVALAALSGAALGHAHSMDLKLATDGIRLLGTEAVISGGRLDVVSPRFQVIADLEGSIEQLAERFRVFARAQERAILAREAATRTRGLFFASVSHDLKGPLNAILGFAELVRMEPLTSGQAESLGVIQRRGRELLALIETILDAARVEAGQLSLYFEHTEATTLLDEAFDKARDLAGDRATEIVADVGDESSEIAVDRVRMARALSTLIAFAMREARSSVVRVRASSNGTDAAIHIQIPGRRTVAQLDRLLLQAGQPGAGEHRGLALSLSLARSIIELHRGTLRVVEDGEHPAFVVTLPGAAKIAATS